MDNFLALIFFLYGLAFFTMGMVVSLEARRGTDVRLVHALRPLGAFGIIHGVHEWVEMFYGLELLPGQAVAGLVWEGMRVAALAFSFLSLSAFGASLLSPNERVRRVSLLLPLGQVAVWGFGILSMRGHYPLGSRLMDVADVWTRYILGVPSALAACAGLIAQQRAFRKAGMSQFGRDSLWAAVAFAWYGLVGQMFTRPSALPPSTVINQELFIQLFGFPVQVLRALAAGAASSFVIRFLRSFEVARQRQIEELRAVQLREAQRREALRGNLLKKIVAAQEAERQRVARELHDETGQALTAIGLGLRGVRSSLPQDVSTATRHLKELEKLVSRSLDELQRLIADLRPSHLDDLGLAAALRWYVGEVQQRTALQVQFDLAGEERPLAAPVKTALFRVAQEALTNVLKHAQATSVHLILYFGEFDVSVIVEDDGVGFDVRELDQDERPAWGILGMRERAHLLKGKFTLDSRLGEGTRVEVTIPYQQDEEAILEEEVPNENTPATGG